MHHQVYESLPSFQGAECGTVAAVPQLESKFLVETDRTSHVMDGEGHCTDVLDHPSRFHRPEYGQVLTTFQLRIVTPSLPFGSEALARECLGVIESH